MDNFSNTNIIDQLEGIDPDKYSDQELAHLVTLAKEVEHRDKLRKIDTYYPPGGVLGRDNYPKHIEFFNAGEKYKERCMIAANRVGKSEGVGAYEVALHLTGEYPDWWEGKRFDRAVNFWCAGDTGKTVRDIIQLKLLGPPGQHGTGMIPGLAIEATTPKHGLPDAIETIKVKNIHGGMSLCSLKSYDQRREAFQGTEQDGVWLDEEPPMAIYTECLMRTMTTGGIILCTFTPLMGISDVVKSFMPGLGQGDQAYH